MEYLYNLMDNGGCNNIYLPIVLPIGATFEHEFGTYEVVCHECSNFNHKVISIDCERRSSKTPLISGSNK